MKYPIDLRTDKINTQPIHWLNHKEKTSNQHKNSNNAIQFFKIQTPKNAHDIHLKVIKGNTHRNAEEENNGGWVGSGRRIVPPWTVDHLSSSETLEFPMRLRRNSRSWLSLTMLWFFPPIWWLFQSAVVRHKRFMGDLAGGLIGDRNVCKPV